MSVVGVGEFHRLISSPSGMQIDTGLPAFSHSALLSRFRCARSSRLAARPVDDCML